MAALFRRVLYSPILSISISDPSLVVPFVASFTSPILRARSLYPARPARQLVQSLSLSVRLPLSQLSWADSQVFTAAGALSLAPYFPMRCIPNSLSPPLCGFSGNVIGSSIPFSAARARRWRIPSQAGYPRTSRLEGLLPCSRRPPHFLF